MLRYLPSYWLQRAIHPHPVAEVCGRVKEIRVGVSGISGIKKLKNLFLSTLGATVSLIKQRNFYREEKTEKVTFQAKKDIKCPQRVKINRFIESDAVKDVVQSVLKKRKMESDKECIVARAYLMMKGRVGHWGICKP